MMYTLPTDFFAENTAPYYKLTGAKERQTFLAANPGFPDCEIRKHWLMRRFFSLDKTGEKDVFMRAWVLLLADSANPPSFLSKKHRAKELQKFMEMFALTDYPALDETERRVLHDEWMDFTRQLVQISLGSKAYGTTVFGLMPMKEKDIEFKFTADVLRALREYPAYFGEESDIAPLYEAMRTVCVHFMPNTAELLK